MSSQSSCCICDLQIEDDYVNVVTVTQNIDKLRSASAAWKDEL